MNPQVWVKSGSDLLSAIPEQRLEGIIGMRKDSCYEPSLRTGAEALLPICNLNPQIK
jgi:hypothetical protein